MYLNFDAFGYELYEQANLPPYAGTPFLNGLLAEGTLFTNATTGIPSLTGPMQTTLLTGAWPAMHGNYYRGYDREANLLRQTGREDTSETLGEVFLAAGLPTASVQQFALLDKGTWWDNGNHLYLEPGPNLAKRVDEALALLDGAPVPSLREAVALAEPPRFLSLYADDLDALGHNEHEVFGLPPAPDEQGRVDRVLQYLTGGYRTSHGLAGLDETLGRFLTALRQKGLYDRALFAIAADHGMTGLSGLSNLPDLLTTISSQGLRVQLLRPGESALPDTQVVVWTVGLEAHLAFREGVTPEAQGQLLGALMGKEYYGGHLDREELARRGAHPFSGDLLLWPTPPHHFKIDVMRLYPARGQHDTLDPSAQHIFLALAGPGVRKGVRLDTPVFAVDLAPTLAHLMGLPAPAGAQGRVLTEALENPETPENSGPSENPDGEENADVPAQGAGS